MQDAVKQLRRRLAQFNACVPYAGVAATVRPDEVLLPALFNLLPVPQAVGITAPPPTVQVRGPSHRRPCFQLVHLNKRPRQIPNFNIIPD